MSGGPRAADVRKSHRWRMAIRWPLCFGPVWFRVAFAMVIFADVRYWTGASFKHLAVLGLTFEPFMSAPPMIDPVDLLVLVIDRQGALSLASSASDEAKQVTSGADANATWRGHLDCAPTVHTIGLAAPAIETYEHTVYFDSNPSSPPLSTQETASVRAEYVRMIAGQFQSTDEQFARCLRLLASRDGSTIVIQWGWLLHDLCILALLIAIGVSYYVGSIVPWREKRRLERAVIALGAFRCPSCGYSIAGMTQGEGHRCPECGRELVP